MKSIHLTDALYDYLLDHSVRETEVQRQLREETAGHRWRGMQAPPEQAQFLALLVRLIDARRCLELGVYTGYSTLALALALPADGRVVACDTDRETTAIGQRYWQQAGVDDKIELRIAPALETLQGLIDDGQAGTFDLAFIDADKVNYDAYFEAALRLLRPRGLVVIDNVLWGGSVIDPAKQSDDTRAIRALNDKLRDDARVDLSMLPVSDGITLAVKRGS